MFFFVKNSIFLVSHMTVKKKLEKMEKSQILKIHIHTILQLQLLFTQRLLFFVDEKNSYSSLKPEKKIFPNFLLINEEVAKKNIQFFITYVESKSEKFIKNEELIFYLNLFRDERIIG